MLGSGLGSGSGSGLELWLKLGPNPDLRYLQYLTMGSFLMVATAKLHYLIQPPKS